MPGSNDYSMDPLISGNISVNNSAPSEKKKTSQEVQQENSVFYSSYDDNKNKNIELNDKTTKNYIDNGCSVQEDKTLADNVKSKIKTSITDLYKKVSSGFKGFSYDASKSIETSNQEVKSNLDSQLQTFNAQVKSDYDKIIAEAKAQAQKEAKSAMFEGKEKLQITNEFNKNNGIEGNFTLEKGEDGEVTSITVKSDKSGNEFKYVRNEEGQFVEVDKEGNQVKDKNGMLKSYTLTEDGNLERTNDTVKYAGKTFEKNEYGDYVNDGKSYFYDSESGKMIRVYELPEVVITGERKSNNKPNNKPVIPPVTPNIPTTLPEIDIKPIQGNRETTRAALDGQGAKFLDREVNGEKQEIAVYKNSEGEKVRQVINEDGTLENLVAISTLGKNKYITQTEANKELIKQFGAEVADVLIEKGAVPVYEDGEMTAVKVDGRTMTGSELNRFVRAAILEQKNNA